MELGPYNPERYDGNPWHPRAFVEGRIDDLPADRDSVVLYTGVSSAIFYRKSSTPEELPNTESILKTGHIYPGNTYSDHDFSAGRFTSKDPGIFMGTLRTAEFFGMRNQIKDRYPGDGAVLEVQVSTDDLETLMVSKRIRERMINGVTPERLDLRNPGGAQGFRRELEKHVSSGKFDNPGDVLRFLLETAASAEVAQSREDWIKTEAVQWAAPEGISTDSITAVWDINYSHDPFWESTGEYVNALQKRYPEKMPAGTEGETLRTKVIEHAENAQQILERMEELERMLLNLKVHTEKTKKKHRTPSYYREKQQKLIRYLERYEEELRKLEKELEEKIGIHADFQSVSSADEFIKEIEYWHSHAEDMTYSIEDLIRKEKERSLKEDWSRKDVEQEAEFEQRMDEEIKEDLEKLPEFSALIKYLENNDIYNHTGKVNSTLMKFMDTIGWKN